MKAWVAQHSAALAGAARRLWSAPLNSLLSLLVIGIALTLPAAGYVLLDNLRDLGRNASGAPSTRTCSSWPAQTRTAL